MKKVTGLGVDSGVLEPTVDPQRIREWWTRWPHAGIVASAGGGGSFEVVTLPARVGRVVLEQLTDQGAWLGPVMSDDDTIAMLVAAGDQPLWTALLTGRGDGYAHS